MRCLSALVVGLMLVGAPASAQAQASSVTGHYRAYRAALDAGDLTTAETEAELALAASEAANGERTGALAVNLALVRLRTNDAAGALAPAQRGVELAQTGAQVPYATLAALALGRAELATSGQAGADRLAALLSAESLDAPAADVYIAAMELGAWAINQREFERAEMAAGVAVVHANGADYGEAFGAGRARTMQSTAILLASIGQRGGRSLRRADAEDAYRLIGDAIRMLGPLTTVESPHSGLNLAQAALAQAFAVRGAIYVKLASEGRSLPRLSPEAEGDADGMAELGPRNITLPRCLVRAVRPARLQYPSEQLGQNQIGAVVLWIELNEAGEVVSQSVAARFGNEGFAEAVTGPSWSVMRMEGSPANCRMPRSLLVPVHFALRTP